MTKEDKQLYYNMTKEDKQLLLKDLSARLTYNVKCLYERILPIGYEISNPYVIGTLNSIDYTTTYVKIDGTLFGCSDFKPYLRPLCSMTSEEKEELKTLKFIYSDGHITNESIEFDEEHNILVDEVHCSSVIDWLNAHHFDYRGLIEKGLAIKAGDDIYN